MQDMKNSRVKSEIPQIIVEAIVFIAVIVLSSILYLLVIV